MLSKRMIDTYYVEAMVLADDVRSYFDEEAFETRELLLPIDRVLFACESLKVTTRLMHVIAWLLNQRAVLAGELSASAASTPARSLGLAVDSDPNALANLPNVARRFITQSTELYRKVQRFEAGLDPALPPPSPARHLHDRLLRAF